ncbi:MAG: hypothetical protein Q7S80_01035 [bacterium]|nr:hypothetical protein [bacterium]
MNLKQLSFLADVFNNVGTVFAATTVVPLLGRAGSATDFITFITGLLFAIACWWFGLNILKED